MSRLSSLKYSGWKLPVSGRGKTGGWPLSCRALVQSRPGLARFRSSPAAGWRGTDEADGTQPPLKVSLGRGHELGGFALDGHLSRAVRAPHPPRLTGQVCVWSSPPALRKGSRRLGLGSPGGTRAAGSRGGQAPKVAGRTRSRFLSVLSVCAEPSPCWPRLGLGARMDSAVCCDTQSAWGAHHSGHCPFCAP